MKQMTKPPFHPSNPVRVSQRKWNDLTDEGRMVKIVQALIYKETAQSHCDDDLEAAEPRHEDDENNEGDTGKGGVTFTCGYFSCCCRRGNC